MTILDSSLNSDLSMIHPVSLSPQYRQLPFFDGWRGRLGGELSVEYTVRKSK